MKATHLRTPTPTEKETQRALALPKGSPPPWNGQPVSTFPGRKVKPQPGQLSIDDASQAPDSPGERAGAPRAA